MDDIEKLLQCTGFDWDQGNIEKNWLKHKVSPVECEQVFFNQPLIFGCTDAGRLLVVIFTKRGKLLRVISARGMNSRERKFYEEKQ